MEHIDISFTADRYDELVHGGVPEGGDLKLAYKSAAMKSGRGGVCIAFTVMVDGKQVKVQAVTSVRLLLNAAQAIAAAEFSAIGEVDAAMPMGSA